MRMNSPEGKSILAQVRGGAFAHAGETEAIDLALGSYSPDSSRAVLDAGCGLGGTADYVREKGWGTVTGFDIDAVSVASAQQRFPYCSFAVSDVGEVAGLWDNAFDLIYCFNTVYAFPDQRRAFAQLALTARPNAELVIFDYTDPFFRYAGSSFGRREDGSFWQPLHPPTLEVLAPATGWRLETFRDITAEYVRWYEDLLGRIGSHRGEIVTRHGEAAFTFVHSFYSDLLGALKDGTLGGGIFRLIRSA